MDYFNRIMDTVSNWMPFRMPETGITLLGRHFSHEEEDEFVDGFRSMVAFTYRRDFEPLEDQFSAGVRTSFFRSGTNLRSDAGWGCAIRAAQMLLAECLVSRLHGNFRTKTPLDADTMGVISKFYDHPSAPLSIHQFVAAGQTMFDKKIAQWYGPTSAARVFAKLMTNAQSKVYDVGCLAFDDGVIITSEVKAKLATSPGGVIIQLSKKLGMDHINLDRYKDPLLRLFSLQYFRGLASGESTTAAYYFPAASDEHLFYLDPHVAVHPALTNGAQGVTQESILKIPWSRLNPSMTLGFFIKSENEFESLMLSLTGTDSELFEFAEVRAEAGVMDEVLDSEDEDAVVIDP